MNLDWLDRHVGSLHSNSLLHHRPTGIQSNLSLSRSLSTAFKKMIIIRRGSQGITLKCLPCAWPPSLFVFLSLNPPAAAILTMWDSAVICRLIARCYVAALKPLIPRRLKVSLNAAVFSGSDLNHHDWKRLAQSLQQSLHSF